MKSLVVFAVLSGFVVPAQETPLHRVPLTKEEVYTTIVAELRSRGISAADLPEIDDIDLPLAVPIATGTTLRVAESCWDSNLVRQQFRMECEPAGHCVPFLAYAKVRSSPEFGQQCQRIAKPKMGSVSRKPLIRAGDRATVLYHRDRMRMTAFVTCLDRGGEGDVIRVRNQDGHIFRARISSATLLEALPQ